MAKRSAPASAEQAIQPLLTVIKPVDVIVAAPDTREIERLYADEIFPLSSYTIQTEQQYAEANILWVKARDFATNVDKLFADACDKAHKAHTALTGLRAALQGPANQIATRMQSEIFRWREEQNRIKTAEEARQQRERDIENARRAEEAARQNELLRQQAAESAWRAAIQLEAESLPWELDDLAMPGTETVEEVFIPEVLPDLLPPVRLASVVPVIAGGPSVALKPWAAVCYDFKALVIAAGSRAAAGDDSLFEYLEFAQVPANVKARELGKELENVVPGVRATRAETLRRA